MPHMPLPLPSTSRKALGAVLAAGVADPAQEVHDKALLYYRLLQHSVGAAQSVVDVQRPAVTSFADAQSAEIQVRGWVNSWLISGCIGGLVGWSVSQQDQSCLLSL
jgi:hypothetical protein